VTAANPWGITEPASGEQFEGPAAPGADSDLSVVTNACDDARAWIAEHPDRCFRARAGDGSLCLIRKVPQDAYLRTFGSSIGALRRDNDEEITALWAAAYPHWLPEKEKKWARKVLREARVRR